MRVTRITAAAVGALIALATPALAQTSASAVTDLNIRSGPGPQFEVIGVIPSAAGVTINGCAENSSWCQVTWNGIQGWASSDYLAADLAGEPVVIAERHTEINVPVVTYDDTEGGTAMGAASGAIAGALIGGPVGAAIGTAAGAVLGDATDVPDPVVSYVRSHSVEPVYLEGEVVVGASLPETVELTPVPDYDYSYVHVNGVPAVVEPSSRRIVHIVR